MEGSEGFTYKFFIGEWTVNLSSVEEGDPSFDGSTKKGDHLLLIFGKTI
jgi:hypothetical protein